VSKYKSFLGKRVEVRYRTGYVYSSATGSVTVDNGSSVFIEDHFEQNGKKKMLRVEIPYECILSLVELPPDSSQRS
jgi:hypothetical protein